MFLVVGSVGATFASIQAQANDATVINMASRQRMLIQKMTWLALAQPDKPELATSLERFDQTLRSLPDGGPTLDAACRTMFLPPAPVPVLQNQMDEVAQTSVTFRTHIQPADAPALQTESSYILVQLDSVVKAFEIRAQAKVVRSQLLQTAFLAAALLLLAWGYFVTRRRIIRPRADLAATARFTGCVND